MIAGRLHWKATSVEKATKRRPSKLPNKRNLASFEFSNGTLTLTEAGTQRRASLHLVEGAEGLRRPTPADALEVVIR